MINQSEWVTVPREPTPEMVSAGRVAGAAEVSKEFHPDNPDPLKVSYAAMLSAAPPAPAAEPVAIGEIDASDDGYFVELYPDRDLKLGAKVYTAPPPVAKAAEPVAHVDCIGLALDLEYRAKTVESQTTERAMLAAARGLRLLAAPPPVEASKHECRARLQEGTWGEWRTCNQREAELLHGAADWQVRPVEASQQHASQRLWQCAFPASECERTQMVVLLEDAEAELSCLTAELEDAQQSRDWHARRCDLLQQWQSKMRDPERTIVCDILANGATLPDPNGTRYGVAEPASGEKAGLRFDGLPRPESEHSPLGKLCVVLDTMGEDTPAQARRKSLIREAIAALSRLTAELSAAKAEAEALRKDAERIDAIVHEYWRIEPFDMPTGAGDNDVGWKVVEHHMNPPRERVVAEVYKDDPRAAIDAAIAAQQGEKP